MKVGSRLGRKCPPAYWVPGGLRHVPPGTRTVPETGEESVRRPPVRRLALKLGSCVADTAFNPAFATVRARSWADTRDEKRPRMKRGQRTRRGLLAEASMHSSVEGR
jgi:hypothetical protein